jgi:hypothetical protein
MALVRLALDRLMNFVLMSDRFTPVRFARLKLTFLRSLYKKSPVKAGIGSKDGIRCIYIQQKCLFKVGTSELSGGTLSVAREQDVFQSGFEECGTIQVLPTKVIADQILIAKVLCYHV